MAGERDYGELGFVDRDRKLTTLGDLVVFVTWWNSLYMAQIISIWEWQ